MEINILIKLFYEFLIVGIFAIGGGMSALPLIEQVVVSNNWLSVERFYQMVAIAESTPGPIGINIATYVGYTQAGLGGAIVASLATVTVPFLFIMVIIKVMNTYAKTKAVQAVFIALKAAILGLILTAAYNIARIVIIQENQGFFLNLDGRAIAILIVLLLAFIKYKKHPLIYIGAGALFGIIFLGI
jgi:chromate transporter